MKQKKTMTEGAIAANRRNATKSPGPQNFAAVRDNAAKHCLLAKHMIFQSEQEKSEFDELMADLQDDHQPVGRTEWALVEEIAIILWKLAIANGWEMPELLNRRHAANAILRAVAENYHGEQLPLFTQGDGAHSAARLGWDCQELVVRTGTRNSEQEDESRLGSKKGNIGLVQVEAKLTTSLDTILRYQAALKRDLYRAIAALREIQQTGHQDDDGE
ncbi:MAG: hypothetical protein LAO03_23450 [Acidobacteriia bacterium]|nr:hypothetical protein [Terriglobia bacterium]